MSLHFNLFFHALFFNIYLRRDGRVSVIKRIHFNLDQIAIDDFLKKYFSIHSGNEGMDGPVRRWCDAVYRNSLIKFFLHKKNR